MTATGHFYEENGAIHFTAKLADFLRPYTRRFAKGQMFEELLKMGSIASNQALRIERERRLELLEGDPRDWAKVVLCGPDEPRFAVRFTVFDEPQGPALAYCIAGPFMPVGFASKAGARYETFEQLVEALECVGLPGKEICGFSDKTHYVTGPQLRVLSLPPVS
jgi:hypothetical protein